MALTAPYEAFEKPGLVINYKLSANAIYKGGLVGVNGSGYLLPMAHATASLKFIGIANETVNNAEGSPGDKRMNVTKSGSFVMAPAAGYTPSQGDIGKEVYAVSDHEVQASTSGLTNQYKVGVIVALETTSTGVAGVRIRIDNHTA